MRILRAAGEGASSKPWTRHFSGTAWMDLLLQEGLTSAPSELIVTSVTFTPGVRTHWHRHEGGQLLVVVSGHGWVGTRDDSLTSIGAGDLIWTPALEDHWHGATETTTMTHLAITIGATHWHDEAVDVHS
jgi:quercetin dioxygenase-like cupin family protein